MTRLHCGLTLGVFLALASSFWAVAEDPPAPAEAQTWNFDRDPADKAPPGWKFIYTGEGGNAAWAVAADPAAPTPPNVLTLPSAASPDRTFNLAIAEGTSYGDVDLSVRLRANSGKVDQGGGLIWRCRDENNYYICRINPLESNFRVYKVVEGKRTQLESATLTTAPGRWHLLEVRMVGNRITCSLDGTEHLRAEDDTFKEPGVVGVWTKADAATSFDDLAARAAQADEPVPAPEKKPGPAPSKPAGPE